MRILVVDDHPGVREAVSDGLELAGHQVQEATSLAEAQNAIEGSAIDAVICDGRFPAMDGHPPGLYGANFVKGCRWRGLAAVLFTADDDLMNRAIAEGIPALLKPADIGKILSTLESQCFHHPMIREEEV